MMFAERHCASLGVRRDVVQVNWSKPEREIPLNRDVVQMKASVSPAFLPGRNLSFLALATAHAAGIQADEVQIGLNCVDFSGYPDCTVEFFDAFKATLAIADPSLVVSAPLLKLSKRQIAEQARSLGLGEWDTWSCYRPQLKDGSITPCHECDACRLHAHAWQKE